MDDQTYAANVKKALKNAISQLDSVKQLFLANPEKDFTRNRKINFIPFFTLHSTMKGTLLSTIFSSVFSATVSSQNIIFLNTSCTAESASGVPLSDAI